MRTGCARRDRAWPRSALATAGCLTLLAATATCHAALSQLVPGQPGKPLARQAGM
jgi:hypothetical protein